MSQITTHVLDTAQGRPAAGLDLALYRLDSPLIETDDNNPMTWTRLGGGRTNSDGRVSGLLDDALKLAAGTYRMHFSTAGYFTEQGLTAFYPFVDVVFELDNRGEHYHIPLLLSPFAYSTYRGS